MSERRIRCASALVVDAAPDRDPQNPYISTVRAFSVYSELYIRTAESCDLGSYKGREIRAGDWPRRARSLSNRALKDRRVNNEPKVSNASGNGQAVLCMPNFEDEPPNHGHDVARADDRFNPVNCDVMDAAGDP